MLTNIPKLGDQVVIAYNNTRTHPKFETATIKKIGRKYLYVVASHEWQEYAFYMDGKGATVSGYELFDNQEAYEKSLQRDRNITKIKDEVERWSFGNGLSDETLEQILELIEVKQ